MKKNHVLEKLRDGKAVIGSFLGLGSPNVAELMAHAGLDFLVIETEHNGLDSFQVEHMIRAVDTTDTIPIVRIPSSNHVFIQRALDMGAMGILVPSVKTADEAREIVSATRYPPVGKRSWGPLRASAYTFDNEDYFNRANDNILIALIIETKEAVENIEAIADVPGIDVVFVGPWDLCLSLGLNPLDMPLQEIEDVGYKLLEIAWTHPDVAAGFGSSGPDQLKRRQAQGFTFLPYGPDYTLLANAVTAGLKAFERPNN